MEKDWIYAAAYQPDRLLFKEVSEFRRRTAFYNLKHSDKGRETGEARLQGNLGNGYFGVYQQFLCLFNSFSVQIFIERISGKTFE